MTAARLPSRFWPSLPQLPQAPPGTSACSARRAWREGVIGAAKLPGFGTLDYEAFEVRHTSGKHGAKALVESRRLGLQANHLRKRRRTARWRISGSSPSICTTLGAYLFGLPVAVEGPFGDDAGPLPEFVPVPAAIPLHCRKRPPLSCWPLPPRRCQGSPQSTRASRASSRNPEIRRLRIMSACKPWATVTPTNELLQPAASAQTMYL